MRRIKKQFILTLFLLIFPMLAISTFAQTGNQELVERAEMLAEIKKLRAENENLAKQNVLLTQQIVKLEALDELQEKRIAELKISIDAKDKALQFSDKIENLYEQRVVEFKEENKRLREENEKLRKSKNKFGVISLIGGIIIGAFIK